MSFESRKWVIFDTSETGSIDFSQVMENSKDTLRLNVSGSKTFVKYEGDMPSSVSSSSTRSDEYTNTEIRNILTGSEWLLTV